MKRKYKLDLSNRTDNNNYWYQYDGEPVKVVRVLKNDLFVVRVLQGGSQFQVSKDELV